ncbi:aminopeptidase [Candidatus Woesearchaeota archaeon]|nr:aminopeptidase [Candidatus Woesearchaeota archaeon]
MDKRINDLADIVLNYSVELNDQDKLLVMSEREFSVMAETVAEKARAKGGEVKFLWLNLEEERLLIERSIDSEIEKEGKYRSDLSDWATSLVKVKATTNPTYLDGVEEEKVTKFNQIVIKPFQERQVGAGDYPGTKWNLTAFPCEVYAKQAGITLKQYANLIFLATIKDWDKERETMQKVKNIFDNANRVELYVEGHTQFSLSLAGRGGKLSDGKKNLPGGETFYGPVEDSAEGVINFPYVYEESGKRVKNIVLKYKNGEVVDARAEENQEFLESVLEMEGMKRIGELGLGTNKDIEHYICFPLFDEKIGGTIHIAIGRSYPYALNDGGGLNKAALHWDLISELRKVDGLPGGEIYVNDNLVQKNGIWLFENK